MRIADTAINAVRAAVSSVTDPEYPDLTIQQLGILEDVVADSISIRVDLVPTILGCPALEVIEKDVVAAARASGYDVTVRFCMSPIWTPDRISEDARQILAEEYIVTIRPREGPTKCPLCGNTALQPRSDVGGTACRSVEWCPDCRNPVEVVRSRQMGER